jgi:hypothetical protein
MVLWGASGLLLLPAQSLAGPEHDSPESWARAIDKLKPGVIMVGSSMQGEGIDFRSLSQQIGTPVMDARSGGSMSAWKYCFQKYVIPKAKHPPKVVIIITRLNFLVCPQKRLRWTVYQKAVNQVADKDDRELLDKLAFSNEGRPEWKYRYDQPEGPPYDCYYWDFNKAVETSFLPHQIELAKKGGYQLVIARYKSRSYADDPNWEPPEVKKFGEDLTRYLKEHGVIFLDYAFHPDIKPEHYGKGDHLTRTVGRPIWTHLVAEDLKAILAGRRAPNDRTAAAEKQKRDSKTAPETQPAFTDKRPDKTKGA